MVLAPSVAGLFKWRQFEPEVILLAVGCYLRFSLSYRDVEELFGRAGPPRRSRHRLCSLVVAALHQAMEFFPLRSAARTPCTSQTPYHVKVFLSRDQLSIVRAKPESLVQAFGRRMVHLD